MDCSTPGLPVHHQLPEPTQAHLHRVGDASQHLILCHPFHLLPSGSFPTSQFFASDGQSEHSGLISFRMDWFDRLTVQGTLKSLLQNHSSKASILWYSAFFTVQLSLPYMTTGKTIALTRQTLVGKVMSLLLNILSMLVITSIPKSKRLLTSWLQSPSAVILEPPKIKSDTVSTVSPSICHQVMGLDTMIFIFLMLSFKPTFSLSSFTFIKRILVPLHFLPQGWCHLHI